MTIRKSNNQTVRFLTMALMVVVWSLSCNSLFGQNQVAGKPDAEQEEQSEEEQLVLDLGSFHLKELRPTRNETIKVVFSAHLVLKSELTEDDFEILQNYQHRLRDQVIVAVRIAHANDFREPDLQRLRRLIQIRIDQVLRSPVTENLLLSEYQFSID